MKKEILPAYFSTRNKGKITLYIRKEYEEKLSKQDINIFFDLYKNSNESNTVYHGRSACKGLLLSSLKNEGLVVRDYVHGGFFGKILRDYLWHRLRPLRELSVCEIANEGHILTTEIIAIIMKNIVGPLYKCKLVSKEITDTVDLMELLLRSDKNSLLAKKRQIISEVAKAIKEMHDVGIYHADLHLKNILIQPTGNGAFKIYIIDLDKSRQFGEIGLNRRRKNILRLDRSLEKFKKNARRALSVTNTDKMRFLREYIRTNNESQKTLRPYLKIYQTTHKLHRFWWLIINSFS